MKYSVQQYCPADGLSGDVMQLCNYSDLKVLYFTYRHNNNNELFLYVLENMMGKFKNRICIVSGVAAYYTLYIFIYNRKKKHIYYYYCKVPY